MYAWLYLVISVLMRSSPPETEVQTWDMQRHCTAPWQPLLQVTFHLLWMSKIIRLGLALWCCESSWNLKHFKAMAVPASASLAVLNMRKKVPVEWNHSCCSTRDTIILINNEDELLSILGKICMSKLGQTKRYPWWMWEVQFLMLLIGNLFSSPSIILIGEAILRLPVCSWAGNDQLAVSLQGGLWGRQEEVDVDINLKFYIKIDVDFSGEEESKSLDIFEEFRLIKSSLDQNCIWLNVIDSIAKFMPWKFH